MSQYINANSVMPKGYAGQLSRDDAVVEQLVLSATEGAKLEYGQPVKFVNGEAVALTANTDVITHIIVREHLPRAFTSSNDFPIEGGVVGGMRRGYIVVPCDADAVIARGAAVKYDRTNKTFGTTGAVSVNATFMSNETVKDGFVEIAFNI